MQPNPILDHVRGVKARLLQILLALAAIASLSLGAQGPARPAEAAIPEADFPIINLQPYADGLSSPTVITSAQDGSGRLFVAEKSGTIQIITGGAVTDTFLDITERVSSGSERGLLGLAFPPGYAVKQYFYVDYTNLEGDIVIARYDVSADPNAAIPTSESILLTIEHSSASNHNGGMIAFGPDGYLYIAVGDAASGGNAQRLDTLLGKVLRIDVEGISRRASIPATPRPDLGLTIYLPFVTRGQQAQYFIPPDNPFIDTPGALPEIWAYGLRNPWKLSFDRLTGDLFVADVGQNTYEEVNHQPAGVGGQNYGWPIMEGPECFNAPTCDTSGLTLPVASYEHGAGGVNGCSITGGYAYRGAANPSMQGFYYFSDYCSGRVWGLALDGSYEMMDLTGPGGNFATFGEDEDGELYIADISTGEIFLITEE